MKHLFRSIILLSIIILGNENGHTQNLHIELKLKNTNDSCAYLAHYMEGKVFADDTTKLINGVGTFKRDSLLPQGIYMVYLPSQKYFDLLLGEDQEFLIQSDSKNLVDSLKIFGSRENEAFADFQQFMKIQTEKNKKLQSEYQKKAGDKNAQQEYKELFKNIDLEVKAFIKKLNEEFPKPSFVSQFANFTLSPEAPDFNRLVPKDFPNREKEINLRTYLWTKDNYFANLDPADDRYLRTPNLESKLKFFYEKILIQQQDSIVKESVKLIEQARPNKLCFQYYTQYAINYAIQSNIMGVEGAFVDIAKRYFLSGQATWADPTLMAKIEERVINLQHNLLHMEAQDLALKTADGEFVRLHEIEADYTILYFFETDCGHCKKVTPRLKNEILDAYQDLNIKVMAIYTQQETKQWQTYIEDNLLFDFINCYDPNYNSNFRVFYDIYTTPIIYLLDKNKKIIAKRLDIDTLKTFLNNEKIRKTQNL